MSFILKPTKEKVGVQNLIIALLIIIILNPITFSIVVTNILGLY